MDRSDLDQASPEFPAISGTSPDSAGVMVKPDPLRTAIATVLQRDGADPEAAAWIADVLVNADLSGHPSHGVFRIAEYHRGCRTGHILPGARPRLLDDQGTTVTIDGGGGFGQIAARFASDAVVERAQRSGLSVAALRRCSHVGRLGDYVERIATAGMMGIMMANDSGANPLVVPPGGTEGRLATNPIAFGIPRERPPHFVFDMATSTVAYGALVLQERWRGSVPSTVLEPVGGHKGFGLALAVEAFAGILTGAGWGGSAPGPDHQGVLLVAIDPERFCGRNAMVSGMEQLVAWVKSSPQRGPDPLLVAGEAGERARARNRDSVQIDPITWKEMLTVFAETGVSPPS